MHDISADLRPCGGRAWGLVRGQRLSYCRSILPTGDWWRSLLPAALCVAAGRAGSLEAANRARGQRPFGPEGQEELASGEGSFPGLDFGKAIASRFAINIS
jgi:hypothetical protein